MGISMPCFLRDSKVVAVIRQKLPKKCNSSSSKAASATESREKIPSKGSQAVRGTSPTRLIYCSHWAASALRRLISASSVRGSLASTSAFPSALLQQPAMSPRIL